MPLPCNSAVETATMYKDSQRLMPLPWNSAVETASMYRKVFSQRLMPLPCNSAVETATMYRKLFRQRLMPPHVTERLRPLPCIRNCSQRLKPLPYILSGWDRYHAGKLYRGCTAAKWCFSGFSQHTAESTAWRSAGLDPTGLEASMMHMCSRCQKTPKLLIKQKQERSKTYSTSVADRRSSAAFFRFAKAVSSILLRSWSILRVLSVLLLMFLASSLQVSFS